MLLAPLPPPVGGIATWTTRILSTPADPDIQRIHVDTSAGARYGARLTARKAIKQISVAARVLWRIVHERPDVIHVTTSYDRGWPRDMLFLSAARAFGSATILNFRGGDFDRMYSDASVAAQRTILRQLRRCDAIVAITLESERFLKDLGLTNVSVIPNCIDVRIVPERRRFDRTRRWLFVGNVMRAKGIVELFEALRRFPDAHLTLVGPAAKGIPDEGADLVTRATADAAIAGRVTHIDQMPPEQVRDVYSKFDMFVFPTHREGFPNALLEAMEAGMPLVAARVGAIPDMIVDGEHGLLVDSGDQPSLEAAIARLASDPESALRMGSAARDRVAALYDLARVAPMWFQLYRLVAPTPVGTRPD
jgi:glycosyltransferase involved in cell wall biosynthesis